MLPVPAIEDLEHCQDGEDNGSETGETGDPQHDLIATTSARMPSAAAVRTTAAGSGTHAQSGSRIGDDLTQRW
jgi:hypothetical protein